MASHLTFNICIEIKSERFKNDIQLIMSEKHFLVATFYCKGDFTAYLLDAACLIKIDFLLYINYKTKEFLILKTF